MNEANIAAKYLNIQNIGNRLERMEFGNISKMPTSRITDWHLEKYVFAINDENGVSFGRAKLKFLLRFTPADFESGLARGTTRIDGHEFKILDLLGFSTIEAAGTWLFEWMRSRPSILMDSEIALYIYQKTD